MAKIFYCGGSSGRLGMLRAVIPVVDLSGVLSSESPKVRGQILPQRRVRLSNYLLRTSIKDDVFARRQRLSFFDLKLGALQISRGCQPSEIHFVYFL
jgi:hypothetical protein